MDPVLGVIKDLLEKDPTLKDITVLTVNDIILLLVCVSRFPVYTNGQMMINIRGKII